MSLRSGITGALQAVPVFVKVMGIALGMTVLLGAGMLWQIHRTWYGIAVRELERRGRSVANELAERSLPALQAGNQTELQRLAVQTHDGISEIGYLAVVDSRGQQLARSAEGDPNDSFREVAVPIGEAGEVRVGLRGDHVDYEVAWLTRRLARTTGVIAALGMLGAWWLTRLFTRPIGELVAVTHAVKTGNFAARAPVRANDEVGELAAAFNEMTSALAAKEAARQALQRKAISAAEEERKRLARELHDQTGQALTSLIAGLSALEPSCPKAADLRQLAEQTLSEVHDVSVALRPSALDDLGLVAALQKHCATLAQRFAVNVDCQAVGLNGTRLPAEIEIAAYRVAQESLSNAVRHGRAKSIQMLLQRKPTGLLLVIEDDGCGFDAAHWRETDRLGLLGIEERAALFGGSLRVESRVGAGTTLFVEFPA